MAFHLGSLGFLTSFRFQDFREKVTNILEGEFGFLYLRCVAVVQMKNTGARFETLRRRFTSYWECTESPLTRKNTDYNRLRK